MLMVTSDLVVVGLDFGYTLHVCTAWLASCPGLLTPVLVACSTNVGEGLVELSHVV